MAVALFHNDLAAVMPRIHERVAAVLDSGRFVLGPEVAAFEAEFAEYLGVRHVVGVANGTDAITIGLRALGLEPGDEVVAPAFTFYATVEAAVNAGVVPVFCDVDPVTRNVTVQTVRAVLTPRTKAISAVDLFGCPAPVPELRELGLPVLEDAAQAAGASLNGRMAGALGDAATFSFYPSKNLGCFGDGGAIATDDEGVAELARALRFHGSADKETFTHVGYNSRLDEVQAAILRVLLAELDGWCATRRAVAEAYAAAGLDEYFTLPQAPDGAVPAWHLYVVTHPSADRLLGLLRDRGIGTRGYYRTPLHRQPAMAPYAATAAPLPVSEELAARNIALPMGSALEPARAQEVMSAVADACAAL
jgi:UDP-N-acetyl-3-dehydro-alpha-D-glucosamine 3-aminotranferase